MMKARIAVLLVLIFVCISAPVLSEEAASPSRKNDFRIGAGVGIPYGGIGVNTEYRVNKYSSLSAGLGYAEHDGPGWAIGTMLYPLKNDKTFNPRLAGYFGRVSTIHWNDTVHGNRFEGRNGGILGGGFEWRVQKQLSFDFDLFYIFKDLPPGFTSNRDVGASVGLGVVF